MEFHAEAKRYCDLIEDAEAGETDAFIADLASALADVVAAATHLPDTSPSTSRAADGPTHEEWKCRFAAVHRALGDAGAYWTTSAPFGDQSEQVVELPLADDLVDVWRDLKAGLIGVEQGLAPEDIHLGVALRLLHALGAARG